MLQWLRDIHIGIDMTEIVSQRTSQRWQQWDRVGNELPLRLRWPKGASQEWEKRLLTRASLFYPPLKYCTWSYPKAHYSFLQPCHPAIFIPLHTCCLLSSSILLQYFSLYMPSMHWLTRCPTDDIIYFPFASTPSLPSTRLSYPVPVKGHQQSSLDIPPRYDSRTAPAPGYCRSFSTPYRPASLWIRVICRPRQTQKDLLPLQSSQACCWLDLFLSSWSFTSSVRLFTPAWPL